jgi:aerobic-type carbon monoxide dehydrogenase small subunit (CoxS/CutS family)
MRRGLDGNICRCGTFVRIMEAANKARGVMRG